MSFWWFKEKIGMWLWALLLLYACNQNFASDCIDSTLRCTHRRVSFPIRKDLPETRETLDNICRDQNEYYDCLQNIPGGKRDGDIPPTADKLNRLDAEYMLSELCTEGLKARTNYLKHAVCINKQKTDVCTSPEFLIILLANENSPSRCSIQNKVISCVSMMLAMNCGAEAGFLYRRLLHIANDGDVHCNSGEGLGEVFSLFKSAEENKNIEGDQFDSRFGEVSDDDLSNGLLFRRLGEISEGVESESTLKSDASSTVVQDYEHASEKPFESDQSDSRFGEVSDEDSSNGLLFHRFREIAESEESESTLKSEENSNVVPEKPLESVNSTFLNDAWNGMESDKDWVLQTVYGRSQPLPPNSNIEESQDASHLHGFGFGQKLCSPFEVNSKKQAIVDEQCFDKVLEHIVETEDNVQESENIYMKSDDADEGAESKDEMELPETSSITEMYTDPSTLGNHFDFQRETSTPDGISANKDQLTITQLEFSEHEASPLAIDNITLETSDGPNTLKDHKSFNEQDGEFDVENEKSHNPIDMPYLYRNPTEFINEETSESDSEYSTVSAIDESGSVDSVRRNIYTITDIFDHGNEPDASKTFENSYFVDEKNIVSEVGHDPYRKDVIKSEFENEDLAKQHETHDALKEIVKRIGEIEVEFPVLESVQYGINKAIAGTENLSDEDVSELNQHTALLESDKNEFQSDFRAVEDSVGYEDSSGAFSGEGFETGNLSVEMREYFNIEKENITNKVLILDSSEAYKNHRIEVGQSASVNIKPISVQDQGSGSVEIDQIQGFEDLKQTRNFKVESADFSTDHVNSFEAAENFVTTDAVPDEIGSGVNFNYESSSSETDYVLDLNGSKLSKDSLAEGDKYVTAQQYLTRTFEKKEDLKVGKSAQDLKLSNEDTFFSSAEMEYLEGSGFEKLPVVDVKQESTSNVYELVNDPAKDLTSTDINDEYSVSGDNDFSESSLDGLKQTTGAVEDAENYELQKTETSTDRTESLEEIKPDLAENEMKNFDFNQPIIIKLSDEDLRKYYELKSHERQNFILQTNLERSKLDSSEMYYLNDDSSKFQIKDLSEIDVPKEWGYEEIILEPDEIDSAFTDYEPVEDIPLEGKIYSYEYARIPLRRSLNIDNSELIHLSEDSNSGKKLFSPQNTHESSEKSANTPIFISESLKLDSHALNLFDSDDLTTNDEEPTLEKEGTLLSTQLFSDAPGIEATDSEYVESIENPEEIIMKHLDNLLQDDTTDSSSGDSTIEENLMDDVNQKEMELENKESVNVGFDEGNFGQLIEEQSKCRTNECEQLVSNQLSDEVLNQEEATYRIETNKIKTLVPPYSEKFLIERLTSNKVHLPRDPVLAFVNENDSQVFIRDAERVKIPCLKLFNIREKSKYFECYIDSREPTYVYLPNFTAFD